MNCHASQRPRVYTGFLIGALLAIFFVTPSFGANKRAAQRANDLANIRSLGQAALIYASDHNNQLPNASSIEGYARQLFEAGNISADPSLWQSRIDPATDSNDYPESGVFASKQNPGNTGLFKPCVAVALGPLNLKMPATTPIIWTRGLQTDGTWAKYSPYGTQGGMIVFLDGRTLLYRNLSDEDFRLTRFDGKGKTSNILDALPPGTRIGEYEPTAEEKIVWARAVERQQMLNQLPAELWIILALWLTCLGLAVYKIRRKKGGVLKLFIWTALITLLLSIFTPAC